MKKLIFEASLNIARDAEIAINDNWSIYEFGHWTASNVWESKEFDLDNEEEAERYSDLRMSIEEQMELAGLPDSEWTLNDYDPSLDY